MRTVDDRVIQLRQTDAYPGTEDIQNTIPLLSIYIN